MTKKISFLAIMGLVLIGEGCVKETYNMDKLSDKVKLNPALAVPGFRGKVTFSDLVKPGDTVVFDADKFVRVIFREDSVINLKLKDFYDFSNMVSYSKTF